MKWVPGMFFSMTMIMQKKQFIELGDNQGFYYTVESGLNAQDILITEGLTRLRDKTLIRIVNPDSVRLAIKE